MLCNNCNQENSSEAGFCSKCGHQLSDVQAQTPPPLTPVNISKDAQISQNHSASNSENADALLAAFVGEKYDSFYRDKWFKNHEPTLNTDNKKFNFQSFNLAGFFLGSFWFCYRKMYLAAFLIIMGITVIDLVLMYLLGMEKYSMLGQSLFIGVWAGFAGVMGNYFYLNHSVKKIKKITDTYTDSAVINEQLAKQGGTSWIGSIGVTLLLILLSGGITYLLAPEWYWIT